MVSWSKGDHAMRKVKVSPDGITDEGTDIFEAYTDDSLPRPSFAFTREETIKFLDSSPYDYRFMKRGRLPYLRLYRGQRYEDIPSTPIPTSEGDIFEGYFLDGFDVAEIE
jgi:hypothetical protein